MNQFFWCIFRARDQNLVINRGPNVKEEKSMLVLAQKVNAKGCISL
jgi:hypothetical protein